MVLAEMEKHYYHSIYKYCKLEKGREIVKSFNFNEIVQILIT